MIALGTIKDFSEGWAIVPFVEKPHYWTCMGGIDAYRVYESNCGLLRELHGTQQPIVPGNFPKCKRCQRSVDNAIACTDSIEAWAARKAK